MELYGERVIVGVGDPESCINAVKLHQATGVDQVQFLMATETIGHEQVMKSIELFGKLVIPAFKGGGGGLLLSHLIATTTSTSNKGQVIAGFQILLAILTA